MCVRVRVRVAGAEDPEVVLAALGLYVEVEVRRHPCPQHLRAPTAPSVTATHRHTDTRTQI
eukprot:1017656-Rhodomonas_salina.1